MVRLTMYRGDTKRFVLTVTVKDPQTGVPGPQPLTGCELWMTAKRHLGDADTNAVFVKTIGHGIELTDVLGGLALVKIESADTVALPGTTDLEYDVQMKDTAGNVTTIAAGRLVVMAEVTRSTT